MSISPLPTPPDQSTKTDAHPWRLWFSRVQAAIASLITAVNTLVTTVAGLAYVFVNSSSNGSYTLPGGLIIKWGTVTTSSTASTAVTFATAFPTAIYYAVVSSALNIISNVNGQASSQTAAGFNADTLIASSGARQGSACKWFSIGN